MTGLLLWESQEKELLKTPFMKELWTKHYIIYRKTYIHTVYILEGILVEITNAITNLLLITNNRTFWMGDLCENNFLSVCSKK